MLDESPKKPSRKIPGVCEKRQTKWLSLFAMLNAENGLRSDA